MDTQSEKAAGLERNTSIHLHYSRQFQSGGQAHTIDAEVSFPVGAGQETREQVIRELEIGVEQLARQITQRNTQPADYSRPRPQTPTHSVPERDSSPANQAGSKRSETAYSQSEGVNAGGPRQTMNPPPIPATRTPVSESMPTAPTTRGESDLRLADFIQAIKRRWNMSPKEAMDLLNVKALDKLNYREAYRQLQSIVEQKNGEDSGARTATRPVRPTPLAETPHQAGRENSNPLSPSSLHPARATGPGMQTQNQATVQTTLRPGPKPSDPLDAASRMPESIRIAEQESEKRRVLEAGVDFAGSPKGPIPIRLGAVRDIPTAQPRKFAEEEDEEELEELEEEEDEEDEEEELAVPESKPLGNFNPQLKLEQLREIRGNTASSVERLAALNNVVSSQISEERLEQILKAAWSTTNKKRLKTGQVEALISWAKEDFFEDEVEAVLILIANEEA